MHLLHGAAPDPALGFSTVTTSGSAASCDIFLFLTWQNVALGLNSCFEFPSHQDADRKTKGSPLELSLSQVPAETSTLHLRLTPS